MAQLIALEPLFERIPATTKKFHESVVFVHHYGGHRRSFKKQMDFINELGFDVVTFDLPLNRLQDWGKKIPVNKYWSFGLRHVWADRIESVLGALPEKKFVYSFSSPSAAALMAISRRHAIDISGWICDGGPLSDMVGAIDNLLREGAADDLQHRIFTYPLIRRKFAQAFAVALGLNHYEVDMKNALNSLYQGFPILSFRGMKDPLVLPEMIDRFFNWQKDNLNIEKVELAKTGHLTGMNVETELYGSTLEKFLTQHATKV